MAKEFQRGTFPIVSKYDELPREPYRAPEPQPVCEYPEVLVDTVVIKRLQRKGIETKPSQVRLFLVALWNVVKPHLVEAVKLGVQWTLELIGFVIIILFVCILAYFYWMFAEWSGQILFPRR
jgi:hypothetical protein